MARIAVVGGGISGLAVGLELRRAGADFVVLEASDSAGGVIGSTRVDGRVLELGPQRLRLTPALDALVAELRLRSELVTAPDLPLFVFADGRLRRVPLSPRDALSTDLIGWRDRLRLLIEPLLPGIRDDDTAADFFTRKLGPRLYRRLAGPLFGGLYGSDPADMPARHALTPVLDRLGARRSLLVAFLRAPSSRRRPTACSFRNGLQSLTDAMARRLGDRLRTVTPVRHVQSDGRGFRILGETSETAADLVILTAPAGPTADLLESIAPDAARRIRSLRYNPIALVHLDSDADLRGLGYQVALDEPFATRGVTWNHVMFDRTRLYTAFLGGATRADVVELPADRLGALAVSEFRTITGHDATVLNVHKTRMPAWDRSWDALDELKLPPGIRLCANWFGRPGVLGRIAAAGEVVEGLIA